MQSAVSLSENQTYLTTSSHGVDVSNVTLMVISNSTESKSTTESLEVQFLPWDNPDSVVSAHTEDLVRRVRDTVVLPLLFLIGGPANVINMAVFRKQGLKERINVCLFALSLADFIFLVCNMLLYGEQIYLQFTTRERYGPMARFMVNNNLIGFFGFTWVSQIISAIIASERCFCILQPLRSQTVLRTSTTTTIIVIVKIVVVGLYSLVTTRYRLASAYDPLKQGIIWTIVPGEFYLKNQELVNVLDAVVYGAGLPLVMIVVVAVTTMITTIKLRQAAAWRAGTSSSSGVSSREIALTKMLVYNSLFFIICGFPIALFRVVWLFVPEMNAGRPQHNLYFMCIWILDMLSYANASFNIVVYYIMGSRYRETFWMLLGRRANASMRMVTRDEDYSSRTQTISTSSEAETEQTTK